MATERDTYDGPVLPIVEAFKMSLLGAVVSFTVTVSLGVLAGKIVPTPLAETLGMTMLGVGILFGAIAVLCYAGGHRMEILYQKYS